MFGFASGSPSSIRFSGIGPLDGVRGNRSGGDGTVNVYLGMAVKMALEADQEEVMVLN